MRLLPIIRSILYSALLCLAGCSFFKMEGGVNERTVGSVEEYSKKGAVISSIELIATWDIPTGTRVMGSEIGGISGIAYDPLEKLYYLLSDDRSDHGPARFYAAEIDTQLIGASKDPVRFTAVIPLQNEDGDTFAKGSVDPEGIVITPEGDFYISSEGNAKRSIAPFVNRFAASGRQTGLLPLHDKYLPKKKSGIRNNLAFESLTLTPDNKSLITATENSLIQDGPKADVDSTSISRIIVYDLPSTSVRAEHAYRVNKVEKSPLIPGQFRTNGLVELLAVDNHGTLLALERAYSVGRGNSVKLFEISTKNARNIQNIDGLVDEKGQLALAEKELVQKRELLDFSRDVNIAPDNLEAMCFGPTLADGSRLMIVVSDNNFNKSQKTQFIFLKLR